MAAEDVAAETDDVDHEDRRVPAKLPSQHDLLTTPSFFARPRALYLSIFCWVSVAGGRFLALFLENVAHLSGTQISLVLALQQLVLAAPSPCAASLADARERTLPRRGRVQVMACGFGLGTVAFLLHGWVRFADVGAHGPPGFVRGVRVPHLARPRRGHHQPLECRRER
jgi:MFS family permease